MTDWTSFRTGRTDLRITLHWYCNCIVLVLHCIELNNVFIVMHCIALYCITVLHCIPTERNVNSTACLFWIVIVTLINSRANFCHWTDLIGFCVFTCLSVTFFFAGPYGRTDLRLYAMNLKLNWNNWNLSSSIRDIRTYWHFYIDISILARGKMTIPYVRPSVHSDLILARGPEFENPFSSTRFL
jgi:hypothetical protein